MIVEEIRAIASTAIGLFRELAPATKTTSTEGETAFGIAGAGCLIINAIRLSIGAGAQVEIELGDAVSAAGDAIGAALLGAIGAGTEALRGIGTGGSTGAAIRTAGDLGWWTTERGLTSAPGGARTGGGGSRRRVATLAARTGGGGSRWSGATLAANTGGLPTADIAGLRTSEDASSVTLASGRLVRSAAEGDRLVAGKGHFEIDGAACHAACGRLRSAAGGGEGRLGENAICTQGELQGAVVADGRRRPGACFPVNRERARGLSERFGGNRGQYRRRTASAGQAQGLTTREP